jgi:anti-sigma factor RsiW
LAENPQRRASDRVDPDVMLAITDGDAENRHILRNEFTAGIVTLRGDLAAVRQDVQVGNLAQVSEFAQIKAQQHELASDLSELRSEQRDMRENFEPRLRKVEDATIAQVATGDLRKTLWRAAATLGALIVAMAGVLVAVLS